MPLHDHFHRPESGFFIRWHSLHGVWATFITQQLNQKPLPERFVAVPQVHLGGQAQVDVGTLHDDAEGFQTQTANGAVATAVWAPPQPPLVVPIDFTDLDVFEIQVMDQAEGMQLVAAIELVSPANKDRPEHRQAFVAKCAAYLQQGVGLVVIDVVTERRANLHGELMDLLGVGEAAAGPAGWERYAIAYRATTEPPLRLEMWPEALALGAALPTLPLWIGPALAVPLDLEASYRAACDSLRIRR